MTFDRLEPEFRKGLRDDIEYYLRREAQERALAAATIDPSARLVHIDLADLYAECARRAHLSTGLMHDQAADATVSIPERPDGLTGINLERAIE